MVDISTTISPIHDVDGKVIGASKIVRDISERKQMENQIRQLAYYDALTNVPNRRLLIDRLTQTIAASKRNGRYNALLFLDLDHFKPLNDMHGHDVGDLLLIEVASRLKKFVRESDTVARFGGDEFVVMLNQLDSDKAKSQAQIKVIAEKIRVALSEPYFLSINQEEGPCTTIEHRSSATIGVALFAGNEGNQEDVIKLADMAMYQAKKAGRNLIRFYELNV